MKTRILLVALATLSALASTPAALAAAVAAPAAVGGALKNADLDSAALERELQRLPWKQFKAVVESEPRLKASVDAYGPLGWQFVQENYRRYGWKKNIDKLDDRQKRQLAERIRQVKGGR